MRPLRYVATHQKVLGALSACANCEREKKESEKESEKESRNN